MCQEQLVVVFTTLRKMSHYLSGPAAARQDHRIVCGTRGHCKQRKTTLLLKVVQHLHEIPLAFEFGA